MNDFFIHTPLFLPGVNPPVNAQIRTVNWGVNIWENKKNENGVKKSLVFYKLFYLIIPWQQLYKLGELLPGVQYSRNVVVKVVYF